MNDEQQQIEDNAEEIMLLKDIASLAEYSQWDKYELWIKVFDDALDGWFEDWDLIIISGASWFWKTSYSQQLAINFAEKWLPVLFLSYEVMVHHLWKKFKTMNINDELPLFSIKRHTTGNVGWIEQKVKEAKEANMIKFVVIDHLWFLIPKQRTENIGSNQAAFVSQIVRELKTLAKNERIVIILPVHVRKTDDPGMNDLKDSSAISQESDAVFILNREKNPLEGVGDYYTDHTLIKMVKNRKTWMNAQGWFQMINGRFVHDNQYVPMPKPQRSIMTF